MLSFRGTHAFSLVCREHINAYAASNLLSLIAKELECFSEGDAALLSELHTEEL